MSEEDHVILRGPSSSQAGSDPASPASLEAALQASFNAVARRALEATGEERRRWDACAEEVARIMHDAGVSLCPV